MSEVDATHQMMKMMSMKQLLKCLWLLFLMQFFRFFHCTVAISDELLEIAREFITLTDISTLSGVLTEQMHCTKEATARFNLYVLHDTATESQACMQQVHQMWLEECLPIPSTHYLVRSIPYSYPLTSVGVSKTHVSALAHFLLTEQMADDISNSGVAMVLDVSNACLSLSTANAGVAHEISFALSDLGRKFTFLMSSASLGQSEKVDETTVRAYVTNAQFVRDELLEEVMGATTLLEYANNETLLGNLSKYSFHNCLHMLTSGRNFHTANIFASHGKPNCSFNMSQIPSFILLILHTRIADVPFAELFCSSQTFFIHMVPKEHFLGFAWEGVQ